MLAGADQKRHSCSYRHFLGRGKLMSHGMRNEIEAKPRIIVYYPIPTPISKAARGALVLAMGMNGRSQHGTKWGAVTQQQ
jgi:hypothetical protein